jgi:hypothetical protein
VGYYKVIVALSNQRAMEAATVKGWREKKNKVRESYLLSPFLNVVLDEFFGVFFEDVINFVDQLVDIFLKLLAGLDDFGVGFDFLFALRFSSGLLLALLFFHEHLPETGS